MIDPSQINTAFLEQGDTSVKILSLGCITQDWRVPYGDEQIPVVLGYAQAEDYRHNPHFMGIIAGRVANRTAGARFVIDGQVCDLDRNEGLHHLHGGTAGIGNRNWDMEHDGAGVVRLSLVSEDGDQGYPGRVVFEVTITLTGQALVYDMRATSDRPTPINLAQHSYYNLMGSGTIRDHILQIEADRYTTLGADKIPTGQIVSLDGMPFDFRQPKRVLHADPNSDGLDLNFVMLEDGVARLTAPNGLALTLTTDQPGLQLYTGRHLEPGAIPLPGQSHTPFAGLCLEPQHFPDTPNQPHFPSILVTPERPYHQTLSVKIEQAT